MKPIGVKIAVKYAILVALFQLATTAFFNSTLSVEEMVDPTPGLSFPQLLNLLAQLCPLILIPMAHYEYNRKNDHYISYVDSILMGLIIIGIAFAVSAMQLVVSFNMGMKEKYEIISGALSERHGMRVDPDDFSLSTLLTVQLWTLIAWIVVLFGIITYEARWKIFTKAGKEGWESLIPIYAEVVQQDIIKEPRVRVLLLLIPIMNIIYVWTVLDKIGRRFGKGEGYVWGLLFLPFIFYPLLGMSKAVYLHELPVDLKA
ncbi:MAG TPA: DUF5684 domain-containing protein [Flavobacteriales bacterium]|nr:hypothetical protein [Flavobacteriales bacterium]MBK6551416.1 hypothetical protein [Flavobacteriales bacterium]MBK7101807.1 hypothetical protein [Flavobacteriales bacterium]MBK7114156.1 hypothetical protein [Flavobacteriales bacterium]MBK7483791.1 hypothetical protein [Flavobacteriales bacterium]